MFALVPAPASTQTMSASLRASPGVGGLAHLEKVGSLKPPFRVNVRSVEVDVEEAMPTNRGTLMCSLRLADPEGHFVAVRLLGDAVTDERARSQSRPTSYYVSGRPATQDGERGSLWAYDIAYTVVAGLTTISVCPRSEVEILG